jgi:4-amino-4-deoxy-L-arabinose transferase-like glycosyltransferase
MAVLRSRILLWLVLSGAAVLLLAGPAGVPLLDPDESRFARTSVEMLHSGDLVIPRFGGEPRLVKPPLIHWVQTFFFSVFGIGEWSARLPAALATLGSIALAGWIGKRRFGDEAGAWTAAVMASTPLVLVPGRVGTVDALLAVHVLAVLAMDIVEFEDDGSYRAAAVGGLLGLAFLAKGPVGVLLPLLVMLAGRTAARRDVVPSLSATLQAVAAWCVVVLPWGLAFLHRIGVASTIELVREEVLDRYFAGTTHVEPPWFYAKVVAVGLLPWLAPLAVALVRVWRLGKEPIARTALYSAAGLLAGLIFFSLGKGKEASYILPLVPLAAILVTWELGRELEAPDERTTGPVLLAGTTAAIAILLGMAAGLQLEGDARVVAAIGSGLFGGAAVVAGAAAVWRRPRWVYGSVAAASATTFLTAVIVLFPAIGQRKSAAPLIDAVPELTSGRPLVTVDINVPSLTFYLGRMPEVIEMGSLEGRAALEDDPLFILADVDLASIPPHARARLNEVGRYGKFVVYE